VSTRLRSKDLGLRGFWEWLAHRFVPPALAHDPEARRRAMIVVGFGLSPVPLMPFLALLYWLAFEPDVAHWPALLILGGIPVCGLVPLALRWTGSTTAVAHAALAYGFVLFAGVGLLNGGQATPSYNWFIMLPMAAVAAAGRRAGVVWLAISCLWYLISYALWESGVPLENHARDGTQPLLWLVGLTSLTQLVFALVLVYEHAKNEAVGRLAEANSALSVAHDVAQSASQAKSEFLANMSHELRTPMTAILGFAEVLAQEMQAAGASAQWIESQTIVRRNGEHLLTLINDILDLSKVEAGHMELESIELSLPTLLRGVLDLMEGRARDKSLELAAVLESPVPRTLHGDPTRLRQVLLNLLGNAIKFTEEGRIELRVGVESSSAARRIRFEILDTGIGMTQVQIERIFEPFSQADTSTTRRFGGTGLGLTISQRLVERMGGTIDVASTPGSGSRFAFSLPAPAAEGEAFIAAFEALDEPAPAERAMLRQQIHGRALLADDGPDNRRLIAHILERAGVHVSIAHDGQQALESVQAAEDAGAPFDVVLMDMQMPVLDGYEATLRLRALGYRRPILALTAHAMQGDRERCLRAGCDGFLTKPIRIATFLTAVAEAILQQPKAGPSNGE
jgi:signal transduction histidine kinase/CheY-like chemotaxis protein